MASLSLLEQLSGSASGWFPILLDVAAKGAAILILTFISALAMRRAPAATRHMVWLLGTCSLLVLPVLSATLPGWHILPQWTTAVREPTPVVSRADAGAASADAGTAHAYAVPQEETPALELRPSAPPVAEYRHAPTDSGPWALTRAMSALSWQAWVLLAWAGGTLILLGIIAGGFLSLRWLEHRSGRITDAGWLSLLSQLRGQLGIGCPVDLLCSAQRTMPMTWGIWRTRILLPADAENWSLEQRRAVLLHELAHAKRWDCLWQLAVQLACALYWFNPLIWLSWHLIQTERERACDDLVLRSGTKPSTYAEQLLHIAEEMPTVRYSAAAIAMARPGTLEGRLRAILDSTRNRRTVTGFAVVLGVALLSGVAVPLAMLRAGAPATGSAEKNDKRINELIYILRHSTLDSREDEWSAAIKELAEIGKPAVPLLVRELDHTDSIFEKSAIAFTMRAIGDPRSVPALIRALPRSANQTGGFGLTLVNEDVQRFMLRYALGQDDSPMVIFSWPLDEVVQSLQRITGHSEGDVEAKSNAPADREVAAKVRREIAERWKTWWAANRQRYLSDAELATVDNQSALPGDSVEAAGLAKFGPMFPAGPDVRLGPVHDFVLPPESSFDVKAYLDFDTGRRFSLFEGGKRKSDRDYPRWIHEAGIDVETQSDTLTGHDIHAWHVDNALWDKLPEEVAKQSMIDPGGEGPSSDFRPRRNEGGARLEPDALPATFLFTTREGGRGVLQILSYDTQPMGCHIRYRMFDSPRLPVVKAATRPATTVAAGMTFGPIREVTLHDPRGNMDAALDFDTGKTFTFTLPAGAYDAGWEKWLDASEASVLAQAGSGPENLAVIVGRKITLLKVEPDGWDHLTPAATIEIADRFPPSRGHLQALGTLPSLPQTGVFQTPKGTVGLVQIVEVNGITGNTSPMSLVEGQYPMTLKLRYKVVQSGQRGLGAERPVSSPADPPARLVAGPTDGSATGAEQPDSQSWIELRGRVVDDESGVMKPGEVPAATRNSDLADRFVADLSQQNLPFLDAPKLDELRSRLRRFVAERIPANLPPQRLQELLAAIDRHVQRCFPKSFGSDAADRLYLAFPDAIMTFQWQLWLAANPQPLTAEQEEQRASQRRWMQDHIRSLPAHRGRSQSDALASLDQLLADPLDPLFATPMDDATFQRFKQAMQKYPAADELPYIDSHFVREALMQRDPTAGSFSLPFEQELVGWGHYGTIVELSFASNRAHSGRSLSAGDIETTHRIIDVLERSLLEFPADLKGQGELETWLAKQGRGHLGYDDAKGGGLFAVRGARLLELQVHSWIEADHVSDDLLRQELESGGGHVVSLAAARQRYRQNYRMGLGDCFIGVLTADGKLSVARVEGFGNNDVQLRMRPRATDPAPSSPPAPGGSSTPDQPTSSPLQSTSATTGPTATTFGPVIERTINLAAATGTAQPERVSLRGQVLDHTGKPVAGALAMLAGHQGLGLTDGKPRAIYQGSRATTDVDGRFALSGAGEPGEHIVVSASSLNVWLAPVGDAGRELTIRLPEPATLTVRYDIEGADEEARVRVEPATWDMPGWNDVLHSVQYLKPRNGNGFVAANVTPGTYDIGRVRTVQIGDFKRGYFCDRTTLALATGQKRTVDFVRKTGQRVKGTVTGLRGTGIPGAAIVIRSPEASGDPRNPDDWRMATFDAVACGEDGSFVTSRLSPGRYKAIAEAYKHEPWEDYLSAEPLPALFAAAEFVVPETGVAAPIVLELKPLPAATRPARPVAAPINGSATGPVAAQTFVAVRPSVDWLTEYQERRQTEANKSPDGWSAVLHDLRARFVPQAGVIKAGEAVMVSIEVENTGTEVREFFWPRVYVPVFDGRVGAGTVPGVAESWHELAMRRTGGSSPDTRAGWMKDGWRVEPKRNVIVTGSLPYVWPREGEYRVRGRVVTEDPLGKGSNIHIDHPAWLWLPELVLKVDAGDPAATLPATAQPVTGPITTSAGTQPAAQQQRTFPDRAAIQLLADLKAQQLPFFSDAALESLRGNLREFLSSAPEPDPAAAEAILKSLHQYVPTYFPANDAEEVYLNFADRVATLQWKLWLALTRPQLSPDQSRRRADQIQWLHDYINAVPEPAIALRATGKKPGELRSDAIAQLDACLSDPLNLMAEPLSDAGFQDMQRQLQPGGEWATRWASQRIHQPADVHFPVRIMAKDSVVRVDTASSDGVRYTVVRFPFADQVIGADISGGATNLYLRSNSLSRGWRTMLSYIKGDYSSSVADVASYRYLNYPADPAAREKWFAEKRFGDVIIAPSGDALVAVRGAKIAPLDLADWFAVDRLKDADLAAIIEKEGADLASIADIPDQMTWMQINGLKPIPPHFYVVRTAGNRLSVLRVLNRITGAAPSCEIYVRTRPVQKITAPSDTPTGQPATISSSQPAALLARTVAVEPTAAEMRALASALSAIDASIKSEQTQEQRQAEANKSPDGWSSVSHDMRVRFVPQAGVIKAGETVKISVEVENSGTEKGWLFIEAQVLAFDGVRTSLLPTTRRTGGSSLDTRGGWDPNGLYVESMKKMVVPWSLPYVLPREGEYRVRGRVLTQESRRIGSNPHPDDAAWMLLPELVLKVDAGEAAATRPVTTQSATTFPPPQIPAFQAASAAPIELILGWNGQRVTVPGPVVYPDQARQQGDFKAWQRRKDVRTLKFIDKDGRTYTADAMGFGKEKKDGTPRELIPVIRVFRPDGTLEADAMEGPSTKQYQIYDSAGQRVVFSALLKVVQVPGQAIDLDGPRALRYVWFHGPDGSKREWQVNRFGVVYGDYVTAADGQPSASRPFEHWCREFQDAPYVEPAMVAVPSSMDIHLPIEVVDPGTLPAVPSSIDSWIKYQEERQAWANRSPDGWSEVSHDLRARFVPQARAIKAGETVTMSIEVENTGTEVREFFQPMACMPAFGGNIPNMSIIQDVAPRWKVEPKKNVIVTGSLPWVLAREGEYRVRGKVATENPIRGSHDHSDNTWLILPELVLKVDAGEAAAAVAYDTCWGEVKDGLRAGLKREYGNRPTPQYAGVGLVMEVENMTDRPIALTYGEGMQQAVMVGANYDLVRGPLKGSNVHAWSPQLGETPRENRVTLQPHGRMSIPCPALLIVPSGSKANDRKPTMAILPAEPGKYIVQATFRYKLAGAKELSREVRTGDMPLTVVAGTSKEDTGPRR